MWPTSETAPSVGGKCTAVLAAVRRSYTSVGYSLDALIQVHQNIVWGVRITSLGGATDSSEFVTARRRKPGIAQPS